MKYNKEDIDKIKQLVFSDDINSVHVGISLAIYTLGMTVKELVDLIDKRCIKVVGVNNAKEGKAFGNSILCRFSDVHIINHLRNSAYETISSYLNELTQEERFEELLKLIKQ